MFRFPTVALAIAGACAIAAATLGVAPLLIASGGSAALRDGLQRLGPDSVALTATSTSSFGGDSFDRIHQAITDQVRGLPLGTPVVTALGPLGTVATHNGKRVASIQLVTREGFESHVDVVAGPEGDGVWLPLSTARALRVHPGSTSSSGERSGSRRCRRPWRRSTGTSRPTTSRTSGNRCSRGSGRARPTPGRRRRSCRRAWTGSARSWRVSGRTPG